MVEKLLIIGGGPAGLSAAIYASREGFNPLVIAGMNAGGQLLLTSVVENFPGFPDGVDGPVIIDLMRKQAEKFGTRFVDQNVTKVDFSKHPFGVSTEDAEYEADSVIIATGANAKWLGLKSEKGLIGKGVSSCATCDGPFFRNKDVIVVGGGDTAMEDSLFLTKFVNSVTIVHRREGLRASKIMQERVRSNPKIKFIWDTVVDEVLGEEKVTGVKLKNLKTGETNEMKADGLFVAIGYSPNTSMFEGQVALDEQGYIEADEEVKTNIEGIFVAGDVADKVFRQAATASGSGVKAALLAREYLLNLDYKNKD